MTRPRILFVALPYSVHTARWLSQLNDAGWDIYLFPSLRTPPHSQLRRLTYFSPDPYRPRYFDRSIRMVYWTSVVFYLDGVMKAIFKDKKDRLRPYILAWIIKVLRPDIVHSLEIQHAGYLTLDARKILRGKFPAWIVTNWGSDIYLFGRLAEHRSKIEAVLASCDYYSCECQRDIALAKDLGFKGETLPVFPNTGGVELEKISLLKSTDAPASRRMILLKGYQHWAGRALVGLQALHLCADLLHNYTIAISMASPEVRIAAELFSQETKIPIEIIPSVSHDDMLRSYGQSRIYIGLSISDAISTSLLEAIVMGAFPIQSCTACADEWIVDGQSGFIVPPEDPHEVARAIRRALSDDMLVNRAAEINARTAKERLDYSLIQPQVIKMYQDILREQNNRAFPLR